MGDKIYCVYIMTSPSHSVIYVGFSSDLAGRVLSHKQKLVRGFTQKYNCTKFVYYEATESRDAALAREKQIKGYSRIKKVALINIQNPSWKDLSDEIGLNA